MKKYKGKIEKLKTFEGTKKYERNFSL